MISNTFLDQYRSSLVTCTKCRMCMTSNTEWKLVCPIKERFKFISYSSAGMLMIARGIMDGKLDWGPEIADVLYTCTMCNSCATQCRNIYYLTNEYFNVPYLVERMREELVNRGKIPPVVRDCLKSLELYGNPFNKPGTKRDAWAEGLGIPSYSGQEFLFYVGDVGSFDDRAMKVSQNVGPLLMRSGISMGILGKEEMSDGNETKAMGENGLFEMLVEKNIEKFKKLGVKKIIALSPHAYNSLKNEYGKRGGEFEVFHYTQIVARLIREKKFSLPKVRGKVTYHDPCYLGRHNSEYEAPREILKSIPGLELIEMKQIKEEAFCCGGGGGNFFTSMLGSGPDSPSRIRVRQAYETGAEILAVACPLCAKMLDDAVKDEGLEEKIRVKDLVEIIGEARN